MRFPLVGGAYQAKSIIANAQRCVNLYPEANLPSSQAPVPVTHYPTPGLKKIAQIAPLQPNLLWVTSQSCAILQFSLADNGNIAPPIDVEGSNTGLTGPLGDNESQTCSLDFDSNGYKFVVENVCTDLVTNAGVTSIRVFSPGANGNVEPAYTIEGDLTGLYDQFIGVADSGLFGICLDANDNIYVGQNTDVLKFDSGAQGNVRSAIFTSFNRIINCLEYDAARKWIWATLNTATFGANIYAIDLSGNIQRAITLSNYIPLQLTVDPPTGDLVVAVNRASFEGVMVLDSSSNGVVTSPKRFIHGTDTTISSPLSAAIDADGVIYVGGGISSSPGMHQICAFASGADGNVGPIRSISGSLTRLDILDSGDDTAPNCLVIHA